MAVYYRDDPGLGELLGTGVGKGISQLVSQKMEQMQKRSGLESLGLSPEKAKGLAKLPGKIGEMATQQELRGMQQSQNLQNYMQITGMSPALSAIAGEAEDKTPKSVGNRAGAQVIAGGGSITQALEANQKAKANAQKIQQKESLAERKFQSTEDEKAYQKVKPFIERVDKAQSVLGDEDIALAQIEEEMESGDIISPESEFALRTLGVTNPSAMIGKPSGEMIQSALKTWLRNVREYFGARPVQFEVEKLMESLPTLMNTQEGRRRIITSLRGLNKLKQNTFDVKNKILDENKGRYPVNLQSQVHNRTKDFHDKLKSQLTGAINLSNIMRNVKGVVPIGQKIRKDGNVFIHKKSGWDIFEGE